MERRVLNVGGGETRIVPPLYKEWRQDLLDIDPAVHPDLVCDAKLIKSTLKKGTYDAVYCSHNLEHFYRHEVSGVLEGFRHVLKRNGFVHVAVPDVQALMEAVVQGQRTLTDIWYTSGCGPVSFHDVLYGYGRFMAAGNLYYAHKTGFTERSLTTELRNAHFPFIYTARDGCNITAFAFMQVPSVAQRKECGL